MSIETPPGAPDTGPSGRYQTALSDFLRHHSEDALYRASLLSQEFVENGLGPEEIIALHFEQVEAALTALSPREQVHAISDAHQFLLEVMIAYGVKYREYLELRLRESLREAELRASQERQHALELEMARNEHAEILSRIAHELNTPITGAKGNLDLALRSLSRGQPERVSSYLDTARQALDRLSRLSADLVHSSHGDVPLDRSPQQVDAILSQAATWARAAAGSKAIDLRITPGAGEARVLANADALLSIFGNLLSNAVRYTAPGGTVTVNSGAKSDCVWVMVRDTGIGMSPEVRKRIFDKFYRAPEARQHEAQGLGLGLALVRQLVEGHQGQIEVESEPGKGSAFRVVLPLAPTEEDAR